MRLISRLLTVIVAVILYHLHNGVNRVYLEGSWLDGLYPSLEV